jgi:hypothetical protein
MSRSLLGFVPMNRNIDANNRFKDWFAGESTRPPVVEGLCVVVRFWRQPEQKSTMMSNIMQARRICRTNVSRLRGGYGKNIASFEVELRFSQQLLSKSRYISEMKLDNTAMSANYGQPETLCA